MGAAFASQLGETTFALISGNYEREGQQLDAQYQNELKLAGDNADAKQKIEEQYAKRKAELQRKQALADREQALFTIALNTAMGVASVLSTGGGTRFADLGISVGILTAFVLATGALQAAAVLAKPLPVPAYKDGKPASNSYAGPALAGEAGVELLVDRQGYAHLFDGPTLFNTQPGDTIYPAAQTAAILAGWSSERGLDSARQEMRLNQESADTIRSGQQSSLQLGFQQALAAGPAPMTASQFKQAFIEAWQEAPRHETVIDAEGLMEGIRQGTSWHEHREKRRFFR